MADQPEPRQININSPIPMSINIDDLRKRVLHFAIPCYGGMITESTMMSMIKWANQAKDLGLSWTVETLVNESLITRGRNTLVAKFLNNPNTTDLFFVDSDIGFEPWQVLALMAMDKDVACGLYPMKTVPVQWVVNAVEGQATENDGNWMEVTKSGTGFMMIKQHVFEKLIAHPAVKPFVNDIGLPTELNPHMRTYFDTAVREGRYYSEDWTFCENWRDIGGEIWVDRRINLRHSGSFVFCAEADMNIRKKFETAPLPLTPAPEPKPTTQPKVLAKSKSKSKKK